MNYRTTTNRYLVTDHDVSYAMTPNGIDATQIRTEDVRNICDAPTKELAEMIAHAHTLMPNMLYISNTRRGDKKIRELLRQQAILAAAEHQQCRSLHVNNHALANYNYVYDTDMHRYILAQRDLSYAHSNANPSIISERKIHAEDMHHICFIDDEWLARFLRRAASGSFGTIGSHEQLNSLAHNTVVFADDGTVMLRDGRNFRTLDEVLTDSGGPLYLYLNAVYYQRNLCHYVLTLFK